MARVVNVKGLGSSNEKSLLFIGLGENANFSISYLDACVNIKGLGSDQMKYHVIVESAPERQPAGPRGQKAGTSLAG